MIYRKKGKEEIVRQRKHLESCFVSRRLETRMVSNSATKSKGFGKKTLNSIVLKVQDGI